MGRLRSTANLLALSALAVGVLAVLLALASCGSATSTKPPNSCSETSSTNIMQSDEHYSKHLDRDGDGVACESAS